MSKLAPIEVPNLVLEKPGMRLEYDGWRDAVNGALRGSHSNQKETRWYRFTCSWADGHTGEIVNFEIAAKHQHPDNWVKGTAPENRKDVRDVARRVSTHWRNMKLKEQDKLCQVTRDHAAVRIIVHPKLWGRKETYEAWWIDRAILLEPHQFGRCSCRESWIEVLPIGDSDRQTAEYIAQIYADAGSDELAVKAAQLGLSLSEIKRVMTIEREMGWREAEKLIDEIVRLRTHNR